MKCTVDHIVYNCGDLEKGVDAVEKLTGVRATMGGKHTNRGTHNALLSLGEGAYLEIIAPDPSQPGIVPRSFRLYDERTHDALSAFAVRPTDGSTIEELQARLGAGPVVDMQRMKPDGTLLKWQMTPGPGTPGSSAGGVEPWIIDWKDAEHPSVSSPVGCKLVKLEIADPRGESIGPVLIGGMGLATPIDVCRVADDTTSIVAVIESPNGIVRL